MNTPLRLGAFAAALVAALAISFGIGSAVGPVTADAGQTDRAGQAEETEHAGRGAHGEEQDAGDDMEREEAATGHAGHGGQGAAPGGLQVSEAGYTLELDEPILAEGTREVSFRIDGPDGHPVTDYVPEHEKELHFIAVRRDTAGFQHVHPVRDEAGTWRVDVDLTAGDWRFFADFHPAGHDRALTLGADAAVAGAYDPQPIPAESRTAHVDGYEVTLDGDLAPGESGELTLTVRKDGRPVTDLEPYLGAYGHLVALRAGDLGYLHVHPEGEPGDGETEPGPAISFAATAPSAGAYRLYLDFQHGGVVRTAEFTLHTAGHGEGHGTGHTTEQGDDHGHTDEEEHGR